jgi:hypothetical protein
LDVVYAVACYAASAAVYAVFAWAADSVAARWRATESFKTPASDAVSAYAAASAVAAAWTQSAAVHVRLIAVSDAVEAGAWGTLSAAVHTQFTEV